MTKTSAVRSIMRREALVKAAASPYEQGFSDKCAELGVDPAALVKRAGAVDFLRRLIRVARGGADPAAARVSGTLRTGKSLGDMEKQFWAEWLKARPQ